MLNVYFERSSGEKVLIGSTEDKEGAWKIVYDFLKAHNYESYYQRVTKFDDGLEQIDVGSHTEFFWFLDLKNRGAF